ncbi:MAG: LLM class flavin-dependent oxidoreductase, partial [Pseudonocardiaceae bacterium]
MAQIIEERAQDVVFFAEHTHIPASRKTPWPEGPDGAPLPRKYWHCYDLFVALTAAAAATSTLRVGSGICLIIERDPIITAKEVASMDHLSGGRCEFGIGAGWNCEEMRNHGTDPR